MADVDLAKLTGAVALGVVKCTSDGYAFRGSFLGRSVADVEALLNEEPELFDLMLADVEQARKDLPEGFSR